MRNERIPNLELPDGLSKLSFLFAGDRLYRIVLHEKYRWSDVSSQTQSALGLSRNFTKQEAEDSIRKAKSNLRLQDNRREKIYIDYFDIRSEPGITLIEFNRIIEAAWKKNILLSELLLVQMSAYERAGIIRSPNVYIRQGNRNGGNTAIDKTGNLTIIFEDSGWEKGAGNPTDRIYVRGLHSHWIWTEFVDKYGRAYVTAKQQAALGGNGSHPR